MDKLLTTRLREHDLEKMRYIFDFMPVHPKMKIPDQTEK